MILLKILIGILKVKGIDINNVNIIYCYILSSPLYHKIRSNKILDYSDKCFILFIKKLLFKKNIYIDDNTVNSQIEKINIIWNKIKEEEKFPIKIPIL